jgi:exopolysaccharide biosynthesis polyprenyl glycosylphosphotransferase
MRKPVYRFITTVVLALIAVSSFAFVWLKYVSEHNNTGHLLGYGNIGMALSIYFFLFVLSGRWFHAFKIGVERKAKLIAGMVFSIWATNVIEIFISIAITGNFRFFWDFAWRYLLLSAGQSVVLSALALILVNLFWAIYPPTMVLEITGARKNKLPDKLNGLRNKYKIVRSLDCSVPFSEIKAEVEKAESVLINDVPANIENDIVKLCFEKNKRVYVTPKISDIIMKSSENLNVVDTPLFLCRNQGISPSQEAVKRFFDIVLSSVALILLSPILLITAIAIKLDDHGPVFYKQERVTKNDKRFMILKFRSMIVDAEKDGRPRPAGEKDDRITKVGRIIRACRIDELPQLINIIKGDMSIVGPRPERVEHVKKYTSEIPEFEYRHKVKGGLTGYAQVYGKYNTTALDKLKLDLLYITNYSFLLDIQILFETLKILFIKESTEGFDEETLKEIQEGEGL